MPFETVKWIWRLFPVDFPRWGNVKIECYRHETDEYNLNDEAPSQFSATPHLRGRRTLPYTKRTASGRVGVSAGKARYTATFSALVVSENFVRDIIDDDRAFAVGERCIRPVLLAHKALPLLCIKPFCVLPGFPKINAASR